MCMWTDRHAHHHTPLPYWEWSEVWRGYYLERAKGLFYLSGTIVLMNEENEWYHKISAGVNEGPADYIRISEVAAENNRCKLGINVLLHTFQFSWKYMYWNPLVILAISFLLHAFPAYPKAAVNFDNSVVNAKNSAWGLLLAIIMKDSMKGWDQVLLGLVLGQQCWCRRCCLILGCRQWTRTTLVWEGQSTVLLYITS